MTFLKTYRAKWLLSDPWTVIENGYVQTAGETIEAIGSGRPPKDAPVVDLGAGVMMPPLVNAHTHLELSALSGSLPVNRGFLYWTHELIQRRAALTEAALSGGARNAIEHLLNSGCGAVGEISTLGITQELLRAAPLGGVFFQELLGSGPMDLPGVERSHALSSSLAAHAPHTTAPALFLDIKRATSSRNLPMSVHLAESEDEFLFIQSARGEWADFLTSRGIDFTGWPLPAKSPVQYLKELGILDSGILAVHLLYCPEKDMQILRKNKVNVCFCPRSNFLLHKKLPDIPGFLVLGFKPCLGTDSLASCPSLDILDEMAFIFENYDSVSPSDIIAMGTIYGAAALGLERRFGRLAPGCQAPPFFIPIDTDSSRSVPRAVITAGNAIISDYQKETTPT